MARSTFKVLFYVNGSKERNGIVPIMGRVTINGTVAQFSCKQNIPKTLWDVKGNKAKGKSREARDINLALDNIKAQIIKHYQRISDREAFVTAEMVRNAYQGIGSKFQHGHIAASVKRLDKGGYMVSCPYTCPIGSHYPVFAYPFLEHFVLTVECF